MGCKKIFLSKGQKTVGVDSTPPPSGPYRVNNKNNSGFSSLFNYHTYTRYLPCTKQFQLNPEIFNSPERGYFNVLANQVSAGSFVQCKNDSIALNTDKQRSPKLWRKNHTATQTNTVYNFLLFFFTFFMIITN